jgi:hypothetical protein
MSRLQAKRTRVYERPGYACPPTMHEQTEAEQLRGEVVRLNRALAEVNQKLIRANALIAELEKAAR